MKLATYRDGSRDGQLLVVSRDLSTAHYAAGIATRLQQVLDDWNFLSPQLEDLYTTLNQGKARHAFSFDPARCGAPLPRAYQWVYEEGSEGQETVQEGAPRPLMRRGAGDALAGACDDVVLAGTSAAVRFELRLAAVTGDVMAGATPVQALEGIRLLMLASGAVQDDALRTPLFSAFSPVAVTPDELGAAWRCGRMHLEVQQCRRGQRAVLHDAAASRFHLGELIAQVAQVRPVGAGCIVGGVLGNFAVDEAGAPCGPGDGMRVQVKAADGQCVFGVIDQHVRAAHER